jgi:hypothetical protein
MAASTRQVFHGAFGWICAETKTVCSLTMKRQAGLVHCAKNGCPARLESVKERKEKTGGGVSGARNGD